MKKYVKAELLAKNSPSGSYAAGCPENQRGYADGSWVLTCRGKGEDNCLQCERSH